MKKYSTVAIVAALSLALLTGCWGGRSDPTEIPGNESTTLPTTEMTMPTMPEILPDMTDGMDSTTATDSMDTTEGTEDTNGTDPTDEMLGLQESRTQRPLVN